AAQNNGADISSVMLRRRRNSNIINRLCRAATSVHYPNIVYYSLWRACQRAVDLSIGGLEHYTVCFLLNEHAGLKTALRAFIGHTPDYLYNHHAPQIGKAEFNKRIRLERS